MNNIKSKISGIWAIFTALLFVAFMITFHFMEFKSVDLGIAFFIFLFGAYGSIILYVSASLFALIALILGIKILRAQSNERLISLNKRLLIAECVLMLFVGLGLTYVGVLYAMSAIGLVLGMLTFASVAAYAICIITQIGTIIVLKKAE